ncbi:MAG: type II toxin-antitoxin system VapC family toxin [Limisphaerales bacterium]
MSYVIDPSVALAWLLPDETNALADRIRQAIEAGAEAWLPAHWWLEIGNGLLMAERRGRIAPEQVAQALNLVESLPLEEDEATAEQIPTRTMALARKHGLTLYDAAYLELAQRRGAILATFDAQLIKAAAKEHVSTQQEMK